MDFTGQVSSKNSSSSVLDANQVFIGEFEEVKDYSFLSFSIFADKPSAANGLEFQWSQDGINTDRIESSSVIANNGRAFSITIRARFFRIKYVNGSAAQNIFRMGTVYHTSGTGIITKPLKGSVNVDNFAQLVQAPIMAKLPNDSFVNIAGIQLDGQALLGVASTDPVFANIGKSFQATTDNISSGGGETPFLLIDNPTDSARTLRYDKIVFGIPNTGSFIWRAYMAPTITANGTQIFPVGAKQVGQQSALVNLYTLPTASAFGNKFFTARTDSGGMPFAWTLDFALMVEAGFKMLITAQPSAGGAAAAINLEYSEL